MAARLAVPAACLLALAAPARQERVPGLLRQAEAATERGDHVRALAFLKQAHRVDPGWPLLSPAVAAACQRLGQRFLEGGELGRAEDCFREGLGFEARSAGCWLGLYRVAMQRKRPDEAEACLRRVLALEPANPGAHLALGALLHEARRHGEAVPLLARAVELRPEDPTAATLLERARRDAAVETEFTAHESDRFVLAFHGERRGLERAVPEIVRCLDGAWRELVERLGHRPGGKVTVLLYTQTEFERLPRSADWVQAYYDGKVRVPLDSWATARRRVTATIRHELAHAFVHDMAPSATAWLHEGIAQWFEGESVERGLALLASSPLAVPAALRGAFVGAADAKQAARLYAQSLVLFADLHERRGMDGIRWLLAEMARGTGTGAEREERALQTVYGLGLERLIEEVAARHRLAVK